MLQVYAFLMWYHVWHLSKDNLKSFKNYKKENLHTLILSNTIPLTLDFFLANCAILDRFKVLIKSY